MLGSETVCFELILRSSSTGSEAQERIIVPDGLRSASGRGVRRTEIGSKPRTDAVSSWAVSETITKAKSVWLVVTGGLLSRAFTEL